MSRYVRVVSLVPTLLFSLAVITTFSTVFAARAFGQEEFDEYKIRFDTGWFYSYPSGTIRAQGDTYPIDLTKDLSFNSYSTFAGKVDWKFTHKNHLLCRHRPALEFSDNYTQPRHRLGWQSHPCRCRRPERASRF